MSTTPAPNADLRFAAVFEQDASSWEEKLNRVHVLFGQCYANT